MNEQGQRICFFTGHRQIDPLRMPSLLASLQVVLDELIADGITLFRSGGALGFDTLAAMAVLDQQRRLPEIRLELVLPCGDQTKGWSRANQEIHQGLIKRADRVICLHEYYVPGCMQERNRHLVRDSDIGVAFCLSDQGGSAYTVGYAKKQGIRVINLAERRSIFTQNS